MPRTLPKNEYSLDYIAMILDLVWRQPQVRFLMLSAYLCIGWGLSSQAQEKQAPASALTIDAIFSEKKFAWKPFAGRWQKDGRGFERIHTDPITGFSSIVRIGLDDPKAEQVLVASDWLRPNAKDNPIRIEAYEWSADRTKILIFTNTRRVWRLNTRGDYWVLDLPSKRLLKIGGDAPESSLLFAKFSPDAANVAYVHNRDIYLQNIRDFNESSIQRLTQSDATTKINGTFDWVYEEEFSLRDGFRFSEDGKRIAFWEIDGSGIELFPLVDNTSTLYPTIQYIPYPKVGTTNPSARIGVVALDSREIAWMKIPGDPRDNYLPRMDWIDGTQLAIQQLNRVQNRLQMYLADAFSGNAKVIFTETDSAWIDVMDELHWVNGRSQFVWLSERDGWRHIYLISRDGRNVQAVTSGNFDVIDVAGIDEQGQQIYFYASPESGTQKYLYRVQFDGGGLVRVTPHSEQGTHQYVLSPDAQHALVTSSRFNSPPTTIVCRLSDHKPVFAADANEAMRSNLAKAQLCQHEFFRVDIGDSVELDAWCIQPPNFDPSKKYPLIVFVYGEPAGQTVLDQWGGDRGLWHQLMAQQGYVVMSFDNRGTPSPRGRAWRKSVYRQIGILASADQAAAVKSVLASRPYLDAERVGIWGWSGGGSMTLNAMFRYPELYASGVSIAPVPNQLYYDTIYQERYMGLLADNSEGYRLGSPIAFANQLRGELLLIHGTGDDNCHYQTSELLINELIKHNKRFSMFAYPNRTHAIREGENTTRHLYQMMTDHFLRTIAP
jgi:dipeptidyl-peptidase 4